MCEYLKLDITMSILNNWEKYNLEYLDLDWFFVAFLYLGLLPKTAQNYFKSYFNQKLLCALPGSRKLVKL